MFHRLTRTQAPARPLTAMRLTGRALPLLAVAALLCAPAAQAKQTLDGWYALGDFGKANFSSDGSDDDDTTFSFGAGYRLSPQLAAELSYRSLGKPGSVSISAIQAAVVGTQPVQGAFGVYGRVGLGRIDADKAYWRPAFGGGAYYDLSPQLRVRAGYERYTKVEDVSTGLWTVGVHYRF